MPRILLAEFPNVAALKHLVLPSLLKTETLSVWCNLTTLYGSMLTG
jgi:hypothetical protein